MIEFRNERSQKLFDLLAEEISSTSSDSTADFENDAEMQTVLKKLRKAISHIFQKTDYAAENALLIFDMDDISYNSGGYGISGFYNDGQDHFHGTGR